MTVAVPGRRKEIARLNGEKIKPPQIYDPKQLAGHVASIWSSLEHGLTPYFRTEAPYLTTQAGRAHDYMNQRGGEALRLARDLLGKAEWKVLATFPDWLWKTYGNRVATPTERAAYNLMTHLDPEIVPFGCIKEIARKNIGESAEFLEASDKTLLTPRDIWTRLLRSLDELEDFENRLIELEGRETTAIIASGLPNACAAYYLMSEYSKGATTCDSSMLHIQLANRGALQVATLAREAVTWHFGFENVVLVALDFGNLARSPSQGVHQPRSLPDLQWYIGRRNYDPAEDCELLECSCNEDVVRRFMSAKMSTALGNQLGRWRAEESTRHLRVPVLLSMGSCCTAFDTGVHKGWTTETKPRSFIECLRQKFIDLGRNPDADPSPIGPYAPSDKTLDASNDEVRAQVDTVGFTRTASPLFDIISIPSRASVVVEKSSALIVVAQIGLYPANLEGAPRVPFVASLLLANGFGRPLVFFESISVKEASCVAPGVRALGSNFSYQTDMRRGLLSYLGNNNVLIGVHVSWILRALSLALPASRVIDLGTDEAFQRLCLKMAEVHSSWNKHIAEPLATSLDRRIPAVLFRSGLDLYPKAQYDPLAEAYYTAALWCVVEPRIRMQRARAAVYRLKCCYLVGTDEGLRDEDIEALGQTVSLVESKRLPPVTSLQLDQRDVLALLDTAQAPDFGWHGDHLEFLKQCFELSLELGQKAPRCAKNGREYGQGFERCLAAVSIALPSRLVSMPARLFIPWVNHQGTNTSLEHRRLDLTRRDLQPTTARRLLSCWLDFSYQPGLLALAQRDGPSAESPVETFNLEAPVASAPAPDTSPAPGLASTSAGRASPARRALDLSTARTPRPEQSPVHVA